MRIFCRLLLVLLLLAVPKAVLFADTLSDFGDALKSESKITPTDIRNVINYLLGLNDINKVKEAMSVFCENISPAEAKQWAKTQNTILTVDLLADKALGIVMDSATDVIAKQEKWDPYLAKEVTHTIVNLCKRDLAGEVLDSVGLIQDSWAETKSVFLQLDPNTIDDPELRRQVKEAQAGEILKNQGGALNYVLGEISVFNSWADAVATNTPVLGGGVEKIAEKVIDTSYADQILQNSASKQITSYSERVNLSVVSGFNYLLFEDGVLNSFTYTPKGSNGGRISFTSDWAPYLKYGTITYEATFNEEIKDQPGYYKVTRTMSGDGSVRTGYEDVYTKVSDEYNFLIWGGSGGLSASSSVIQGLWVMGKAPTDMPKSGTSSYNGKIVGYSSDGGVNGSVNLYANFSTKSISGTLICKYLNGSKLANADFSATIGNPDKNAFLGSITGTNVNSGEIGGSFYGSKAQEVGGYFKFIFNDTKNAHGIFVAK